MKNPCSDEEYLVKIRNDLANDSYRVRKNCLEELQKNIEDAITPANPDFAWNIFKLAVKSFADKTDSCRERSAQVALKCITSWTLPTEKTVFLLLPVIFEKLGSHGNTEMSEETRLLFVRLLQITIQNYGQEISPFLVDIVDVLGKCIRDRCPDVIKESCSCLEELAKNNPSEFQLHSGKIVEAVIFALKHKHYRIRVAAVHSLGKVILFGSSENLELVCGALGESLLDQNPHVRGTVFKVVTTWLLELRNRYSYFHFMLPLILTGINDENNSYRQEAQNWWYEIGLKYLKENEEQLKDKHEWLPAELENYPFEIGRPNLGCRTLVSKEMCKIVPTLLKELEDWRPEVRVKSSELLKIVILHAEINIVSLLEKILPILCKVYSKKEEIVNQHVMEAAEIIGYFISPNIFWQLMITHMKDSCSLGHYAIFASLLKYSCKIEISEQLNEIVPVMIENNFCETRDSDSSQLLLKIITKLIDCCEGIPVDDNTLRNLHEAIVSVMAFGNEDVQFEATDLIGKLAVITHSSVPNLHEKFLPPLFDHLLSNCEMWESYSLELSILMAVLSHFPDDVFEFVFDQLLDILKVILKINGDKEVVFKSLYTIAELLDSKENKIDRMEYFEKIISGPLKQQLIWKAGKVAEVTRATALSTILLFLKRNGKMSPEFFSDIVPMVISLCEDSYEESRMYSLEILSYVGLYGGRNIDVNLFKLILTVVAGRLEDKRDTVRLKAVQSLKNILLDAPRLDSFKGTSDYEKMMEALHLLFINVDDTNEKIQEAVLELFKEPQIVTNVKSVLSEEILSSLIRRCRHKNVSTMLETCLNIR